jgi:hypothetical protein
MDEVELRNRMDSISWHHKFEIAPGIVTPGRYDPAGTWKHLKITSLAGKRVLDIGARDGYFTLKALQLGADVLAVDATPAERMGFPIAMEYAPRGGRHDFFTLICTIYRSIISDNSMSFCVWVSSIMFLICIWPCEQSVI